ncbi:MAG: hypothetical protein ACLFPW_06360 [Spirochaetaceae bacterium]
MRYVLRLAAVALLSMLVPLSLALAQESGEDDEFSEGFGGEFDTQENEGSGDAEGDGESAGGFGDGFGSFGDEGPTLDWGGMLRFDTRVIADYDEPEESPIASEPEFHLDLEYSDSKSELVTNLEFRPEHLQGVENARMFAEELIDEAHLTLFYENFNLQAGYLREVWGTGDQLHVVDVLNSNDLRDFVNPDYAERRLSRPMFKLSVPVRRQGRFEAVYIPLFEPDRIPREGLWAPAEARELEALMDLALQEALGAPPPNDLTYGDSKTLESAVVEPNTRTLEWGQYAARYRDSLGSIDLALIYYHGFLKQPSVTFTSTGGSPEAFGFGDRIILDYDRVNVFGLEYAGVFGGFNTRAEAAYYLTEDMEGDDPTVTNNSLQYLAGFDRDLPLSNLNVNIQGTGTYYLGSDEIEENVEERMVYDFQYDEDGDYTNHIVSVALSDSYSNETIEPEIALSYGVEHQDWYINPSIEFSLLDDVKLFTEVAVFHGDEGYFGQYDDNDFAEVRLEYSY